MSGKKEPLINVLDGYLIRLLEESDPRISEADDSQSAPGSGTDSVKVGFLDRLKAFEAAARWVGIKNKIDTGDDEDEFGKLRRGHIGGSGSRKRGSPGSSSGGTGDA